MKVLGLSRYDNVKPLDLGGENGEYHTMCLHGPLYHCPIQVVLGEPVEFTGQHGQKEGESWWVINVEPSDG